MQGLPSEVLVAFVTSGFALVGTLAGIIVPKLRKHSKAVEAVREQVQNSHSTNLRDDIDRVLDGQDILMRAVNGIRDDLALERRERIALGERVDNLT